jgi:hypothetical protein
MEQAIPADRLNPSRMSDYNRSAMIGRLRIELLAPERYGVIFIPYSGGGPLRRQEFTGRTALRQHLSTMAIQPSELEAGLRRLEETGLANFEDFEAGTA